MNLFNIAKNIKNIAIIGAGISGLQAGFLLKQKGFIIKIYEKENNIGGVWRSNYFSLYTQTPTELMQIPGFPFPNHLLTKEVLSRQEYFEYLEITAKKMNILQDISFNTDVINVEYKDPQLKNSLFLTSNSKDGQKIEEFSFVIFSHGKFYKLKSLEYKNINNFQGKIYHSSQLIDKEIIKEKKVVIVGYGKSACEITGAVADISNDTTILYKELLWSLPFYIKKNLRFDKLMCNSKLSRYLIDSPKYETIFQKLWHNQFKFLKKIFLAILEKIISKKFHLKKNNIKPLFSIEKQFLQQGIYISSEKFFKNVDLGKIKHLKGEIEEFKKNGIVLKNGIDIDCDVIVFAIGYDENFYILGDTIKNFISSENEKITSKNFNFYKGIIDFRIPNIAIIGFRPAVTSPITYGLQALWIQNFLAGYFEISQNKAELYFNEWTTSFEKFYLKYGINPKTVPFNLSTPGYHKELLEDLKFLNKEKFQKMNEDMRVKDFEPFFIQSELKN